MTNEGPQRVIAACRRPERPVGGRASRLSLGCTATSPAGPGAHNDAGHLSVHRQVVLQPGSGPSLGAKARVMAVSFARYGRLYYLDPGELRPPVGDKVLVPTDDGPEVAECVWAPQWVGEDDRRASACCAGLAGDDDLRPRRR